MSVTLKGESIKLSSSTQSIKGHLQSELVSESHRRRNWKGIALAILVICATVAIIVITVLFTTENSSDYHSKGTLNFDDVISGYYQSSSFNGTFVSEKEIAYVDALSNYVLYNLDTKQHTILVTNKTWSNLTEDIDVYKLSPTKGHILLAYSLSQVYRHTYNAKYKIYNVATKEMTDINDVVGNKTLQYAAWGPTGEQLVYVDENNIYYMKNLKDLPTNVTTDGMSDVIYNGIPDWVYEEEVLAASNAIWWNPNGTKLCYAHFNDTQVDTMPYVWYGDFEDTKNVYSQVKNIRYPKPGRPNPIATLYVVDLANPDTKVKVVPPDDIRGEHYFTTLKWLDADRLMVVWVPRQQANASISICSESQGWKCIENKLVSSKGWVNFYDPILSTDTVYFLTLPKDENYEHLASVSFKNSVVKFLTEGNFEVTEIRAVANDTVYYLRTSENQPNVRHFASVRLYGEGRETCHTCNDGANCTYNDVLVGPEAKYYVWVCGGPGVPSVIVRSLPDNLPVLTWTSNEKLKSKLQGQVLPTIKTMTVPVAGGYEAIVKLFLPDDFSENRKYPILVTVYGGPGTQINTDAFTINWGSYLATVKNYIYAQIDGRGSAYRGDKLLFEIYKHLGTVEIEDQIAVVKYLTKNTRYVDPARTAIWGWSYGGFASSMALATGNDTFKCAASVAPVTSWYYYDSVYTERYMLRPEDNKAGYNYSSVLSRAKNFKKKRFLLIHGTADDNVHVQQSMMLIEALSQEGILFQQQFYPDQNHGIKKYTNHLYRTLQQFFDKCFE